MATTTLLAAGTSSVYSTTVTCVAGTKQTFGGFIEGNDNASKALPQGCQIILEREGVVAGAFMDTGIRIQGFVNELGSGPNIIIDADGVFRFWRKETDGESIGINQG